MANMVSSLYGTDVKVLLAVHGSDAPTDAEWEHYMMLCHSAERMSPDLADVRSLVITEGGGPNPRQRKELTAFLRKRTPHSVIITDSVLVKGIGVAIGWFNPHIRAYGTHDTRSALEFINVVSTKSFSELEAALSAVVERLPTALLLRTRNIASHLRLSSEGGANPADNSSRPGESRTAPKERDRIAVAK